jgi:peptidyl-prolyl cis-trans isomerase C
MITTKAIPIVMDPGALSDAARTDAHVHADETGRSLPGRAPVFLRVGDTAISEADVAREMQHHRAATPHQSRAEAARALVVRELLRREAERLRLPDKVAPIDGETQEEACIRALIELEVQTPVPDESACRRYYEANRERLRGPDRVRVRHILLAASPNDSAARIRAAQLGEELILALQSHPERFTEFAMRHSACPSRDDGGDLGWLERGQTVPEFERQLFMLKRGMAGLTVETRYGHHVVWVDEIARGESTSYEDAADKIAAYLETQVKQNALHQYLQQLQFRYGVSGLEE